MKLKPIQATTLCFAQSNTSLTDRSYECTERRRWLHIARCSTVALLLSYANPDFRNIVLSRGPPSYRGLLITRRITNRSLRAEPFSLVRRRNTPQPYVTSYFRDFVEKKLTCSRFRKNHTPITKKYRMLLYLYL